MVVKRGSFIRVFEVREELQLFFKIVIKSFSTFLEDTKWLLTVANLADIYQDLNTEHQHAGPKGKYLTSTDKPHALENKM
jgi:hypothetical protein